MEGASSAEGSASSENCDQDLTHNQVESKRRDTDMVDQGWKNVVWHQFGAAIDMLQNGIAACPDELWGDRRRRPEVWYMTYHALFFLDCYLSESEQLFRPPAPFTLDELDERGLLPERVYTKEELLSYLEYGRSKLRSKISALTEEDGGRWCGFSWLDLSVAELMLYNMRHMQHHAAQLNLLLSQEGLTPPRWVRRTARTINGNHSRAELGE